LPFVSGTPYAKGFIMAVKKKTARRKAARSGQRSATVRNAVRAAQRISLGDITGTIRRLLKRQTLDIFEISRLAKLVRQWFDTPDSVPTGCPRGEKGYLEWAKGELGWKRSDALKWPTLHELYADISCDDYGHLLRLDVMLYLARQANDGYSEQFATKRQEYTTELRTSKVAVHVNDHRWFVYKLVDPKYTYFHVEFEGGESVPDKQPYGTELKDVKAKWDRRLVGYTGEWTISEGKSGPMKQIVR
jgi:hypothetical protein